MAKKTAAPAAPKKAKSLNKTNAKPEFRTIELDKISEKLYIQRRIKAANRTKLAKKVEELKAEIEKLDRDLFALAGIAGECDLKLTNGKIVQIRETVVQPRYNVDVKGYSFYRFAEQ